ncbi:unnamed protein product [Prorocentrum cordatum]|uniref:Post-GPI attachment to proteins factor 3 n=1 Tax=Prorocentrum cordatum TaxID=2364126 RepID=A0ABN9T5X5_9DINO|nr:unnamed protein product [Polarella glacialis]
MTSPELCNTLLATPPTGAPPLWDGGSGRARLQWYLPPRRSYSRRELRADHCVNFFGAALSWFMLPMLLYASHQKGDPCLKQTGFLVQGFCSIVMFHCSAFYHHLSWQWDRVPVLLTLDHFGVNAMIVGTFTPWMVILRCYYAWSFVVTLSCIGLAMECVKLRRPDLQLSGGGTGIWKRFDYVHGILYISMGATALPLVALYATCFPPEVMQRVLIALATYAAGVLFLASEKLEFHLAVWHSCVLCASVIFWVLSVQNIAGQHLS